MHGEVQEEVIPLRHVRGLDPARRSWLAWSLAAWGAVLLPACGRRPAVRATPVPAGAPVLALGDSLTFGTGAPPVASYPAQLAGLTPWRIVNAGVPGHTAAQALERLPALLQQHAPQLVIVSIGGNDFLRRMDETATRNHIRRIVERSREAGAQVLLVAVPRLNLIAAATGALSDHPLYAEIATEMGVALHAEGWSSVLGDERLRSDAIHANAQGYAQFAEGLAATARAVGLLSSAA